MAIFLPSHSMRVALVRQKIWGLFSSIFCTSFLNLHAFLRLASSDLFTQIARPKYCKYTMSHGMIILYEVRLADYLGLLFLRRRRNT